MFYKWLLFLILNCMIIFHCESKKKYVLNWDSIKSCEKYKNKYTDFSNINIYSINETTIGVKGFIIVNEKLEKRPIKVLSIIQKEMGMNYVMLATHDIDDLCEKIENPDDDLKPFLTKTRPPMTKCPLTDKKFDISGVEPYTTDIELRKELIGSYMTTIKLFRPSIVDVAKEEMWACYSINFKVESV